MAFSARWLALTVLFTLLVPTAALAQSGGYEVWAVDQADASKNGARLYVYRGPVSAGSQPEVVDLDAGSKGVGAGPGVRPHLLVFNRTHSHGVLAWVASGHVSVVRGADRKTVASIDVGEQAHGAVPAPDDSFILVANQNGKKLARIKSDFASEQFAHEVGADLDLKALENPDQPDNAPICPLLFVGGTKAYVTLRGGGLYVVDAAATPMKVLKSFTKAQVAPAGCGGVQVGDKVYINSGTATSGALYVFDGRTDSLVKTIDTTQYGTDSHGMALVGGNRYLWAVNRGQGDNIVVVDTRTDEVAGTFAGFGAAPDLLDVAPGGDRVFATLRGPNNLTGGPAAKGETPGLAVLDVRDGGRSGAGAAFVPMGVQGSRADTDPHALAVRRLAASPVQLPSALPRTGGAPLGLVALLAGGLLAIGAAARIGARR